jgi:hypothetical protein
VSVAPIGNFVIDEGGRPGSMPLRMVDAGTNRGGEKLALVLQGGGDPFLRAIGSQRPKWKKGV